MFFEFLFLSLGIAVLVGLAIRILFFRGHDWGGHEPHIVGIIPTLVRSIDTAQPATDERYFRFLNDGSDTATTVGVTVTEIPEEKASEAALPIPSWVLQLTVLNVLDPFQRGGLLFAYFGSLFQTMSGVATSILRREAGVSYYLPMTEEELRTQLLHLRSNRLSFGLNLNILFNWSNAATESLNFWDGVVVRLHFAIAPLGVLPEPSKHPTAGGVPAVLAIKIHDVQATRPIVPSVVVSVLGRLGGVLLQPSAAGDTAFVPLPDVAMDKLLLSLLDFSQQPESEQFPPLATAAVEARNLVNGKKKVEIVSGEDSFTVVMSTKMNYV